MRHLSLGMISFQVEMKCFNDAFSGMKNCHLSTKWNILPEVTYHMRNLDSCNLFSWYTSLKLLPSFYE